MSLSFIAAFAVVATNHAAKDYASFGPGLNWLLGLPCWLLGCVLADSARRAPSRQISGITIWIWRAAVFATAWVCSALKFHSPIGYPWTLNLFAVLVVFWLIREIQFRRNVAPLPFFEWAGLWSYSLYLIHPFASALFTTLFQSYPVGAIRWVFLVFFVLASCYIFYLCIERPSHGIARKAAQRLRAHSRAAVISNAS